MLRIPPNNNRPDSPIIVHTGHSYRYQGSFYSCVSHLDFTHSMYSISQYSSTPTSCFSHMSQKQQNVHSMCHVANMPSIFGYNCLYLVSGTDSYTNRTTGWHPCQWLFVWKWLWLAQKRKQHIRPVRRSCGCSAPLRIIFHHQITSLKTLKCQYLHLILYDVQFLVSVNVEYWAQYLKS